MSNWDADLESTIFTRLDYYLTNEYSSITTTTSNVTTTPTSFPTVLIHQIESTPRYNLEHTAKTGLQHYMEVQVFSKTRSQCREIAYFVESYMESWGYISSGVLINVGSQYSTAVTRYHRMIGVNDTDIVQ